MEMFKPDRTELITSVICGILISLFLIWAIISIASTKCFESDNSFRCINEKIQTCLESELYSREECISIFSVKE